MFAQLSASFSSGSRFNVWLTGYLAPLVALLLLLAMLPLSTVQAQEGRCVHLDSSGTFYMPSSGFIAGDIPMYLNGNCSPPAEGVIRAGDRGMVDVWDRQDAIDKCNRHNGYSDNTVSPFGLFWSCNAPRPTTTTTTTSGGGRGKSGGGSSSPKQSAPAPERTMAGVKVAAELGMNSGIQFKRLSAFHVGIQSVIDRGVLDVVDIWGHAAQYYEVCFPQAGTVVFLDAATSPRSVVEIQNFTKDGYSCAAMNRAGMMVLVQGSTAATSDNADDSANTDNSADLANAQRFIDSTNDPVSTAIDLENCQVTPEHKLNLRAEPWVLVLSAVPKGETVEATARTQSWFRVTFNETEGWIAAWLTTVEGDCEWQAEDDDSPALADNRMLSPDVFISLL